jgi:putative transposase
MTQSRLTPGPSIGPTAEPRPKRRARAFCQRWRTAYPAWGGHGKLLSFFRFPRHLWKKLRTTNLIERCFVEVRRRARPMVCFVNLQSVDRIIYSIFQRFNLEWKNRTLRIFTQSSLTLPSATCSPRPGPLEWKRPTA